MKKNILFHLFQKILYFFVVIGVMLVVAFFVRLPISPYLDFRVLYFANKGILNGVALYDYSSQVRMISNFMNMPVEISFVIPFPYMPWLALGTLYLGLLPMNVSMTFWLELNIMMLFASIWLLTDEWPPRARLWSFPLVLLFLPVLGTLAVGQYDFPILLGVSMLIYSLRKQEVISLGAAGAWLVMIKPHVGALIFLLMLAYLIYIKTDFAKRMLRAIFISGAVLFLISFAADSFWLVNYPRSLFAYHTQNHIVSCLQCSSLPVFLARWLFNAPSLLQAAWVAIPIFMVIGIVFISVRKVFILRPDFLLSVGLLAVLLSSPYLYNYDFILLLIPFSVLVRTEGMAGRILITVCYLTPTVAIAMYGRSGNISLIIVTVVIGCVLYLRANKMNISASERWQLPA